MVKTTEHNDIYNGNNNKMSTSHTYRENNIYKKSIQVVAQLHKSI